ncbi:ABC transporter permease [Natronomonas sp. EA1]|uniref:ABC transporter permease n=1 Tax=Natronomonas sp. EA1 TaxID=3421655 RepID=UPI003EBBFF75
MNPDSVRAVARKDFIDAVRSRGLLALTTLFVVFFGAAAFFFVTQIGGSVQQQAGNVLSSNSFLRSLSNITRLFVPLTGAVVAYAAIVGERSSGTLKLLLSLPHDRSDVVVGKLLGRGAVVAVPVLLGLLIAVPMFPLAGVSFDPLNYLLFAALTVLVGLAFVAIGVGVSASTDSNTRAAIGTFVPFAFFALLWGQLAGEVVRRLQSQLDLGQQALLEVYFGFRALNPLAAYQMVASSIGSPRAQLSLFSPPTRQSYAQQFGSLPWYLSDAALVGILVLWVVVPVAVGYLAFERSDL